MIVEVRDLIESASQLKMKHLIADKNIWEKCKLFHCYWECIHWLYLTVLTVGAVFCNTFRLSTSDLLGKVDAFLLNNNKTTLEIDMMGKFEVTLHQNQRVNCIFLTCAVFINLWPTHLHVEYSKCRWFYLGEKIKCTTQKYERSKTSKDRATVARVERAHPVSW